MFLRVLSLAVLAAVIFACASVRDDAPRAAAPARDLRSIYSKPPAEWPKPAVDPGVEFVELGLLPPPPAPESNPITAPKTELGKTLFFDPRLSGSGQIACASCHDPDLAWADGRTTSFGHGRKELKRNSPSIMNAAFAPQLFWDGRAASLEDQALAVLANPDEMRTDSGEMLGQLRSSEGYRRMFQKAFGDDEISLPRVGMAIATFVRTVVGGNSDFDHFLKGKSDAMSDAALRGLDLFRGKARCVECHYGPTLSDGKYHDLGLSYYGRKYEDLGRYRVTSRPADVGAFRTPPLRNVTRTGPYTHIGFFELDGMLNMYNMGMPTLREPEAESRPHDPLFPKKSALLKPLALSREEREDLKAFLASLEEPARRVRPPEFPAFGTK